MSKVKELRDKWFLGLNNDDNPLSKRHPGTQLEEWTDGNKVEVLIDGKSVMEHFHNCLENMIRFMEENKNITKIPQIWIANYDISNVELLGPNRGGKAYDLMVKAARVGIKVYILHSGQTYQWLWNFRKLWKNELKEFLKKVNMEKSGFASLDSRMPIRGVQHQKLYVCLWPDPQDWVTVVSSTDFNIN